MREMNVRGRAGLLAPRLSAGRSCAL